jgi:tyrosyl-tRNA synthetase
VLIVGDATAMVGDPSGRNKLRPQLTRAEVEANLAHLQGAGRKGARHATHRGAPQLRVVRRDVASRTSCGSPAHDGGAHDRARHLPEAHAPPEPIGIHEFLYPLMQGWDSVDDPLRRRARRHRPALQPARRPRAPGTQGSSPQVVFTLPLINGLDGRKMSKSYGNSIGLTDEPADMFGKVMSIDRRRDAELVHAPDAALRGRGRARARRSPARGQGAPGAEIVAFFHDADAAAPQREAFDRQFRDRERPAELPERPWPSSARGAELPLANLLREVGLAQSTSEARRNVQGGGVRVDGELVSDPMQAFSERDLPLVLQRGKRHYVRVVAAKD